LMRFLLILAKNDSFFSPLGLLNRPGLWVFDLDVTNFFE
jgi:hypothetical protein